MNRVTIYSDGSASPNPGKGSWACIIKFNGKEWIHCGGETHSTNNRMEISGISECIKKIVPLGIKEFKIVTDSKYCLYGIRNRSEWVKKSSLLNSDIWLPLYKIITENSLNIEVVWVKGHSDNEFNNRCHNLANNYRNKYL